MVSGVMQAGEPRMARIESLRAIAALGVLFAHCYGTAHGYRAVVYATFLHRILLGGGLLLALFFALSGYLLFWPFVRRDYAGAGPVDLGRYARNRVLRIAPLYYVDVVILLLVREHGGSAEQWWRFGLFAESLSSRTVGTVDGLMWSLVVEVQFYILLPRAPRSWPTWHQAIGDEPRRSSPLSACGGACPPHARLCVATDSLVWRYSLPANFVFFDAGLLLALVRCAWQTNPPMWLRGPLGRTDAWLVASAVLWLIICLRYELDVLATVASFLFVGACVLPLRDTPLARLLDWRPLATVGIASYSLYLWHLPIVETLGPRITGFAALLSVAGVISVAVTLVSYRIVEAPFLGRRRRWSPAGPPAPAGKATTPA